MNQNISKEGYTKEKTSEQKDKTFVSRILNLFTIRNIIIYILTLLISMVGSGIMGGKFLYLPLGLSMGVASISYGIPVVLVIIFSLIGTLVKFGFESSGAYVVSYVILFLLLIIKRPYKNPDTNEKMKLGIYEMITIMITFIIFRGFSGLTFLNAFTVAILAYSFYKVFVNAFDFFNSFTTNQALTNEEVVAASVMISLGISNISTYGFWAFYLSNFLCIALILFIGWKFGFYSGMLSGLLSGLIISMFANINLYLCLIYAATGLIIGIYKKINFNNIPDWAKPVKMLPISNGQIEEGSDELLQNYGLNIEDIKNKSTDRNSESYIKKIQIYKQKLFINIEDLNKNLLYDDIYSNNGNIIEDMYDYLVRNDLMLEKKIISIFASHNIFIASGKDKKAKPKEVEDVRAMLQAVNLSYRQYKDEINKVIKEAKKDKSYIDEAEKENNKNKIKDELFLQNIITDEIHINKDKAGRTIVDIRTNPCGKIDGSICNVKPIKKVIQQVLNEKFTVDVQECGMRLNNQTCKFQFISEDKYKIEISSASIKRVDRDVIGEIINSVITPSKEYVVSMVDGKEAVDFEKTNNIAFKNSKVLNGIIENIFGSEKNKSLVIPEFKEAIKEADLKQIGGNYVVAINDLFTGTSTFMLDNTFDVYIKNNRTVENLNEAPRTGDTITRPISKGDIVLIASKGAIESDKTNPNWIGDMFKEIHTDIPQNICDIIIEQAKENYKRKNRNDISVIVYKIKEN